MPSSKLLDLNHHHEKERKMAEESKNSYPMIPVKHWWALRKKFKQSIPGTVTDNYLATSLNMEIKSARANILPYLQQMGIVDPDGKTLDRAKRWRDDMEYSNVCAEILSDCYPSELRDAGARSRFPGYRLKPVDTLSCPQWGQLYGRFLIVPPKALSP
jgi:hypothetical protein